MPNKKPTYKWDVEVVLTEKGLRVIADDEITAIEEAEKKFVRKYKLDEIKVAGLLDIFVTNVGEYTFEDMQECP